MNKRRNRGITLVALVITIILMLILAGATIGLVFNGELIKYAKDAKADTQTEIEKEQMEMNKAVDEINKLVNENSGEAETIPILLANVAQIGDYVNYDPTKTDSNKTQAVEDENLRYVSPKGTGMSHGNGKSEQTIAVPNNTAWRVLSIDSSTGTVELISADAVQDEFTLSGPVGYLYAEQELNEACKIFGHGYGADTTLTTSYTVGGPFDTPVVGTITGSGARSVNMDDINNLLGVREDQLVNYSYGLDKANYGSSQYPTTNIFYPTKSTSSGYSSTGLKNIMCTAYCYSAEFIATNDECYLVASETPYFISSRIVITSASWAAYSVHRSTHQYGLSWPALSSSDRYFRDAQLGIRPVVKLTPNIEIMNDSTKDGSDAEKAYVLK